MEQEERKGELFRALVVGDVVGRPGVRMVLKHLPLLREKFRPDLTIVNVENSVVSGRGVSPESAEAVLNAGADILTSGNHIWDNRRIIAYIDAENSKLIRPANFPSQTPGRGFIIVSTRKGPAAVINVQGRVFMRELLECPFHTVDTILAYVRRKTKLIFVDFHAEATAEKSVMGAYLDGRATAVWGTHTHVQTADERIMPGGTAYITDVGAVLAFHSSIGMRFDEAISRIVTQMPSQMRVEERGVVRLSGILVDAEVDSGKAVAVERVVVEDEFPGR